jgi:hypothetical protein
VEPGAVIEGVATSAFVKNPSEGQRDSKRIFVGREPMK